MKKTALLKLAGNIKEEMWQSISPLSTPIPFKKTNKNKNTTLIGCKIHTAEYKTLTHKWIYILLTTNRKSHKYSKILWK